MSTAAPRLSRLMTMVPWLVAHDGVTIDEAAEHFGISADQCEKDLWLLVVCGLPGHGPDQLVDIQFWDDGRIHVLDPQTLDRPLRLSGDEIMSMLVALRLLMQVPGQHDRNTLHGLIERLETALGSSPAVAGMVVDSGVTDAIGQVIAQALTQSRTVTLIYAAATDDAVTERVVHPMNIFTSDGRMYLEGYCERAEAVRTFRLDRILTATLGDSMAMEQSMVQAEPSTFVATVSLAPAARWALDVYPFSNVQYLGKGRIMADLDYRDMGWLTRVVLSLAGSMVVTAPTEARKRVADAAAAALGSYS